MDYVICAIVNSLKRWSSVDELPTENVLLPSGLSDGALPSGLGSLSGGQESLAVLTNHNAQGVRPVMAVPLFFGLCMSCMFLRYGNYQHTKRRPGAPPIFCIAD